MKLYKVALAPNPTKVMLYIAEREQLGTEMGLEQITVNTVKGHQHQPEHLARNPFGTLPALELDDGTFIVESLAIIHYLEDKFPENAIIRGTAEEKGHARDIERIVDIRIAGPMGAGAGGEVAEAAAAAARAGVIARAAAVKARDAKRAAREAKEEEEQEELGVPGVTNAIS